MITAFSDALTTPDADGSCNLLDATCDENGFQIKFDNTCRDTSYRHGVSFSRKVKRNLSIFSKFTRWNYKNSVLCIEKDRKAL